MALTVKISKSGAITIRVRKADLKRAAVWLTEFEHYDEKSGDILVPKVTDPAAFAKAVYHQLNDEEEDGTTIVHRMFDDAIKEAVEQGAEGIVFPDDKEYGRKSVAR
ncbi:hypothetical protein LRP31_25660 [Mesorhizobium mediterraneum]|uniref:Uncharacterized protein n=1 Tax=Mesorhizobium mediterraneum TaxID=43617 RepID=A0AB36RGT4_9HYPH|nr:hypothetical protein [Mesorhizobium mediterraneum]PAQ03691.1 hypothetical protein CIT25_04025 [Mesorhizobium mediterraneum]WIW52410.1 hypothetical protein LRP31_25660 [Mesorhizobium mediterraneum]